MTMAKGLTSYPASRPASTPFWDASRPVMSLETVLGDLLRRPNGAGQNDAALSEILATAGVALRDAAKAAADAAARARALAEGLDTMLAELPGSETAPVRLARSVRTSSDATIALSRRERQVLALVTQGHTNKAIADALFVSPNTVKTHVTSLLHKFHAQTRTQLAAMAIRQSPLLSTNELGLV